MSHVTFPNWPFQARWNAPLERSIINRSEFTQRSKVVRLPGVFLWQCDLVFDEAATESEEIQLTAFVARLGGVENTTDVVRKCQTHPGNRPTISAATSGYSASLTGMQANTTILLAGQYISIPLQNGHARLVSLTQDLATNGSGNATANFTPALGSLSTIGGTVETLKPFSRMRLASSDVDIEEVNGVTELQLSFVEAL